MNYGGANPPFNVDNIDTAINNLKKYKTTIRLFRKHVRDMFSVYPTSDELLKNQKTKKIQKLIKLIKIIDSYDYKLIILSRELSNFRRDFNESPSNISIIDKNIKLTQLITDRILKPELPNDSLIQEMKDITSGWKGGGFLVVTLYIKKGTLIPCVLLGKEKWFNTGCPLYFNTFTGGREYKKDKKHYNAFHTAKSELIEESRNTIKPESGTVIAYSNPKFRDTVIGVLYVHKYSRELFKTAVNNRVALGHSGTPYDEMTEVQWIPIINILNTIYDKEGYDNIKKTEQKYYECTTIDDESVKVCHFARKVIYQFYADLYFHIYGEHNGRTHINMN
jgi:hypothetical protein